MATLSIANEVFQRMPLNEDHSDDDSKVSVCGSSVMIKSITSETASEISLEYKKLMKLASRQEQKQRNILKNQNNPKTGIEKSPAIYRHIGSRTKRRLDGVAFLETFGRLMVIEEEDYSLRQAPTNEEESLSVLFADQQAMAYWQDFMALSEPQQVAIIDSFHQESRQSGGGMAPVEGDFVFVADGGDCCDEHQLVHLLQRRRRACSLCAKHHRGGYWALQARHRRLLSTRHLPLGWLKYIEADLRAHFDVAMNVGSWTAEQCDSFRRMMTHVLAQYLGLTSYSRHDQLREGQMKSTVVVENPNPTFNPPCMHLDDLLISQQGSIS